MIAQYIKDRFQYFMCILKGSYYKGFFMLKFFLTVSKSKTWNESSLFSDWTCPSRVMMSQWLSWHALLFNTKKPYILFYFFKLFWDPKQNAQTGMQQQAWTSSVLQVNSANREQTFSHSLSQKIIINNNIIMMIK